MTYVIIVLIRIPSFRSHLAQESSRRRLADKSIIEKRKIYFILFFFHFLSLCLLLLLNSSRSRRHRIPSAAFHKLGGILIFTLVRAINRFREPNEDVLREKRKLERREGERKAGEAVRQASRRRFSFSL